MKNPDSESIAMGMRIQQSRKAAKLTQMQFAEKINVSTQYVSDLERGVVGCSIATLIKICDTLKVSSDFILRGQEPIYHTQSFLSEQLFSLSKQEQKLIKDATEIMIKLSHLSK